MTYKDTLTIARLILRPLSPLDFDAVHSWAQSLEVTRYMGWGPYTEEQTREFLKNAKNGREFAVVLRDTNTVVGSCHIYPNINNNSASVGWIIHKNHWHNGYGTEICKELLRYGFENLELRRIYSYCAAENYGSCRILEKNGMRLEALHKKSFWDRFKKEWIDDAAYAILKEEYKS